MVETVALLRHPAPLVAPGVCYGRLDLDLSPEGLAAIAGMRDRLKPVLPALVWSSPALRCRRVAEALGCDLRFDDRLLELDFGAWEGMAWDDVPREALDRWAAAPLDFAAPGGETGAALIARVRAFHWDLLQNQMNAIVVSHGGPLKILRALLRGQDIDLLAPPPAIGAVDLIAPPAR